MLPAARPSTTAEVRAAYRHGVLLVAGGTAVVPEYTRAGDPPDVRELLFLDRAGMGTINSADGVITIGATATIDQLCETVKPLASAARSVGDRELREQATVGGNLCMPRGDLPAPLLALDAQVELLRHDGTAATVGLADILGTEGPKGLIMSISFAVPDAAGFAQLRRPHAHSYGVMAVSYVEHDGIVRCAVSGATRYACRLPAVEAGRPASEAADGIDFLSDPLGSGWYRQRVLPTLVERAISDSRTAA